MTSQSISSQFQSLTMLLELISLIVELNDLSGADECEIKGVGKENNILSFVVVQADLLERVSVPGHSLKMRSWLLNASLNLVVISAEAASCVHEKRCLGSLLRSLDEELSEGLHL